MLSIKPLPQDTSRLLGSSTLITTPVSLVKELVENAIDARAKSIEVLVSPNTVDKIEVRDDGLGIHHLDWEALGRRGHTSKLTCFEDLKKIGGVSLGYRGEGLASANTLGYVAITTRTAKDKVATMFRLASKIGGVSADSKKVSSAPPGTSVVVTCLFSSLPVRRKVAMQDAVKTITAIKTLLCSYALARPQLRLAFKIFQQPAQTWTYVPPAAAAATNSNSMREPVLALFGKDVARPCLDVTVSVKDLLGEQPTLSQSMAGGESGEITFEAFLPRPGSDLTRLAIGGFVSVDGRPLSVNHHQGIAKKLLGIFRGHLAKSMDFTHPRQVRDAFIRLNIKCPPDTYDHNVESSKTDVLFVDEKLLRDAFERLCQRVYGNAERERSRQAQTQSTLRQQQAASQDDVSQPAMTIPRTPTQQQTVPLASTMADEERRPQQPLGTDRRVPGVVTSPNDRLGARTALQSTQSPVSQLRDMFDEGETVTRGPGTRPARSRPLHSTPRQRLPPSPIGMRVERHVLPRQGIQREGILARRPRLTHRSGCRPTRPIEALQTPPSSSPPEGAGPIQNASAHGSGSLAPALPGVVIPDGLRQTTISFRGPATGQTRPETPVHRQEIVFPSTPDRAEASVNQPVSAGLTLQTFMTATNFCRVTGADVELVDSGPQESSSELTSNGRGDARQKDGVGQHTTALGDAAVQRREPTRPDKGVTNGNINGKNTNGKTCKTGKNNKRMPIYVMEVKLSRLKRGMVRFASYGDAKDKLDCLSPDTADISKVKRRLREAVTNWLTRTRAGEETRCPVKVEFYFRRSLKERARKELRKSDSKTREGMKT